MFMWDNNNNVNYDPIDLCTLGNNNNKLISL